jgi:hypothetical protein
VRVVFVDGAEISAHIGGKRGRWFIGNGLAAVCDRYRYRFAETADIDILPVPEIASARIDGEEPYNIVMLNAKTAERRRAKALLQIYRGETERRAQSCRDF